MGFIVALRPHEAFDASRFGPKAANLARLGQAGLPIPAGFCVEASAYRRHFAALGFAGTRDTRSLIAMRIALHETPITPEVREPLVAAWRALALESKAKTVVRSSALVEDRADSSFAGQFESYLGLEDETEFETAVRSCWAALWSTRALRYMASHDLDPADTAMALLVQPLVAAKAAGGALSITAVGDRVINATPGLGASVAQGEVVPERIVLTLDGKVREATPGRQMHRAGCDHGGKRARIFAAPSCLAPSQAEELGRLLIETEELMGMPVEISGRSTTPE